MRYFVITLLAILIVVGIIVFFFHHSQTPATPPSTTTQPVMGTEPIPLPDAYVTPGQHTYYTDKERGFAFQIPKGFSVGNYGVGTNQPEVLLTSADQKTLILIQLSTVSGTNKTLSVADIQQNTPQTTVTDPQPFTIAPDATGVSFTSNGQLWGGTSHEVWFIYNGTLYRVSSTPENATLLDAIVHSWNFTP